MEQNFATSDGDLVERLAQHLDRLMKDRGLSQPQLAQKSGVGQTTISLYLNPSRRLPGKTGKVPSPKLAEVNMLARALGVDASELLSSSARTDEPQQESEDEMALTERQREILRAIDELSEDGQALALDDVRRRLAEEIAKRLMEGTFKVKGYASDEKVAKTIRPAPRNKND